MPELNSLKSGQFGLTAASGDYQPGENLADREFFPKASFVDRLNTPSGAGTSSAQISGMTTFFMRFIGALALDATTYEAIEADRRADMQAVLVVLAATAAGGVAGLGLGVSDVAGFVTGAIIALGGWLVWVSIIATLGSTTLAERQTHTSSHELLRTIGFAAAPGVFVAFAAMRSAAPFVVVVVSIWMIAAAVLAVRQALDFRSTSRAVAVCVISWALSVAFVIAIASIFTRPVN